MSFNNKDNSYAPSTRQAPQKTHASKMKEQGPVTHPSQIDFTKPLSQEELIMLNAHREEQEKQDTAQANTGPTLEEIIEAYKSAPQQPNTEKTGYISAGVGRIDPDKEKGTAANLGADITFVQGHLVRLEMMDADGALSEKFANDAQVSKDQIPLTIAAIDRFQTEVLGYGSKYGYVLPGKDTIGQLVTLTLEQKKAKELEVLARRKAAKEAAEKKKAEEEARKKKELEEAKAKKEEALHILKIQQQPSDYLSASGFYVRHMNLKELGLILKDYVRYNPKFVRQLYRVVGFTQTDNLTREVMKHFSDSELDTIPDEMDGLLYDSLDWGWTTKEEYALMKRLRKGKEKEERNKELGEGEKGEEDTKDAGYDSKRFEKATPEEVAEDRNFIKAKFTYTDHIDANVGKGQTNNKADVKLVAKRLRFLGIENVPDECVNKGEWKDKLKENIIDFQKHDPGVRAHDKNTAIKPDGIVSKNGGTITVLIKNSGLKPIYANRATVNAYVPDDPNLKVVISDHVGVETWNGYTAKNNIEDVKFIAKLLEENGIEGIPEKAKTEGTCDEAFITKIKEFQTSKGTSAVGFIKKGGGTINKLAQKRKDSSKIGQLTYNMETGVHTPTNSRLDYEAKLDKAEEAMGIKKDSDYDKVLSIANRAAADPDYFNQLTKGVTAKLTNIEKNRKDDNVVLSPVLEDRMARFHKFMVAVGMYSGNMWVSDGARSPKRAHRWCIQWYVTQKGESHSYVKAFKENLIKMYADTKYHVGDYIKDEDGNQWAKKEHFTKDEDGNVSIDYSSVKTYIKDVLIKNNKTQFRNNATSPASEGYDGNDEKRLPTKSGDKPSVTNHKTGEAMDIDRKKFIMHTEAMVDLIALRFGLIRDGGATEYWHFEMTDVELTEENQKHKKEQQQS